MMSTIEMLQDLLSDSFPINPTITIPTLVPTNHTAIERERERERESERERDRKRERAAH